MRQKLYDTAKKMFTLQTHEKKMKDYKNSLSKLFLKLQSEE